MIRGIDHLVIACADPDAAASELESAVGLAFTGGGRHPGAGTFNRLAFLADGSYLELIGVEDAVLARDHPIGAAALRTLERGGGLATYALVADELDGLATSLRAAGSTLGPVRHGSRARDDGEVVEWWIAVPSAPLAPDAAPFLIEHASSGAEWGSEALAARAAFVHPIGSPVSLVRLDVAAADPPGLAATLHEELQLDLWAVADLAVATVGPHVLRIVPRREMPVPAVVTLAADVPVPRTAELLGLRFDVERAEVAAAPAIDR